VVITSPSHPGHALLPYEKLVGLLPSLSRHKLVVVVVSLVEVEVVADVFVVVVVGLVVIVVVLVRMPVELQRG